MFNIRFANIGDAQQLLELNEQFNGMGAASLRKIKSSLSSNRGEIVVVSETSGVLAGFVCVRVMRSFCYDTLYAEVSEVFVSVSYRRNGLARRMIKFAEDYCIRRYGVLNFELKTGVNNFAAKALYNDLGYKGEDEIVLRKRLSRDSAGAMA